MPAHATDPTPDANPPDGIDDLVREVQAHHAWVWRYLRFLGCSPALADDLTQETFVATLRQGQRIDPAHLRGYLRKAARNLFHRDRARKRRQIELLDETLAEAAFDRFQGTDEGEGFLTALHDCLETLSERDRAALRWRYAEGASRQELGARLGLAENGVKTLLKRNLARLRACMQKKASR